jgi:hypothetical protein
MTGQVGTQRLRTCAEPSGQLRFRQGRNANGSGNSRFSGWRLHTQ